MCTPSAGLSLAMLTLADGLDTLLRNKMRGRPVTIALDGWTNHRQHYSGSFTIIAMCSDNIRSSSITTKESNKSKR
eukprot:TRINITY_DN521_c0_g1_i2.p1 TRINITY_DN521_c0_g1~~TRINITY_DN521_c0_g1_i2.p1  ORF type:complete len:86 (+),score=12.92 TRINITY_DN521_c0_g1_i2:32-259(+)